VYEAGFQRTIGTLASIDVSVYRKTSRDQQDNNNFFDTGIIFRTTLAAIRVVDAETRLSIVERKGLSGTVSVTTGRAVSTPPFTGGLFLGQSAVDLLSSGPSPIDHDQRLSTHGTASYDAYGLERRFDTTAAWSPIRPIPLSSLPIRTTRTCCPMWT
jgi:hypothetical protein